MGTGVRATNASLFNPKDVFVDRSGIYIADTDNHRIRKVDRSGTIRTVAGSGASGVVYRAVKWGATVAVWGCSELNRARR